MDLVVVVDVAVVVVGFYQSSKSLTREIRQTGCSHGKALSVAIDLLIVFGSIIKLITLAAVTGATAALATI